MEAAPLPIDESARLAALARYDILDTPAEDAFDDLTAIAAHVCGYPIALLSLIDRDRQWFKSCFGIDGLSTRREDAFCAHAILQDDVFEVADATRDPRFADNPHVVGEPGIRAYAGMPLATPDGHRLGTLCVVDRRPRGLDATRRDVLRRLARQAVAQLELRCASRALREQTRRLRAFETVVTRTSHAVAITDADCRITWCNPAFTRVTGYAAASAIGQPYGALTRPGDTDPIVIERLHAALRARTAVRTVLEQETKDGRRYWSDSDIQPLTHEDGSLSGFCAVDHDITTLVETERAQGRRLALRTAVSQVQQAVIEGQDVKAIQASALQAAVTLTGSTHGMIAEAHLEGEAPYLVPYAIVNPGWSSLVARMHGERLARGVRWRTLSPIVGEALSQGRALTIVGASAAALGTALFEGATDVTVVHLAPIFAASRVVGIAALANQPDHYRTLEPSFLDPLLAIAGEAVRGRRESERRRAADEALEQERRRLRLALLASNVGVFELDLSSGVLSWDWRMWELHGVEPQTGPWTLREWFGLVHPHDVSRARREMVEGTDPDHVSQSQFRIVRPDGSVRHVRVKGQTFASGGARLLVGVALDVTADIEIQQELTAQRQQAESAAVAKAQFLATMSHEIRTPMNGVLGMLELLLQEGLGPAQRECARMAHGSAEALLLLLNDILDLSKLEAHQVRLESLPFEPARLIDESLALMRPRAREKGLTLAADLDASVPAWLQADPTRLRQVLLNLVGNAVKFTGTGSVSVVLRYASGTPGTLRVEVRDSGEGIAPDVQPRLFQRFAQADSSTSRRFGGSGLGLAICRELIDLMGGTIGVDSVPGSGSTFWFEVPSVPAAAPSAIVASAAHAGRSGILPRLRILAAEDNLVNQRVLRAFLAQGRHDVHVVASGVEALAALDAGSFDVVLMDIQMPGMDGVECVQAIRARATVDRDLPVIALTANAMAGDRERYLADGFTDYVSKPVTMQALTDALARVTRRQSDERISA
jgi:PAS domain S-box-containing protein